MAGAPVTGSVSEGTIIGWDPVVYQVGSSVSYEATIEAPVGYSNVEENIECNITLGITTDALPTANNIAKMVTEGNSVNIDFSQYASDAEDSFAADTLQIKIDSLPVNGTIVDNANQSGTLSNGDILDNTGGTPTVIYTPTASGPANDAFNYSVIDSANQSVSNSVSIIINAPANQAPIASNITVSIAAAENGDTVAFNIRDYVSDDNDTSQELTYYWCDNTGGNKSLIDNTGTLPTLTHGAVSLSTGANPQLITYEYTGTTLTPNDSPKTDTFYYLVKDSDDVESALASISVTMNIPGNTAPTFSSSGANVVAQQYNTITGNVSQYANDSDGDTLTYTGSITSGLGAFSIDPITGNWTYNSDDWSISPSTTETATIVITADDGYTPSGDLPTYTITIAVTGVSYIQINVSSFTTNSDSACSLNQDSLAYLDVSQATDINAVLAGDNIFQTAGLDEELIPASSESPWISIRQTIDNNVVVKSVQIDSTGIIQNVINCTVSTGLAWPIKVNYNTDASDLCAGGYETARVWQNVIEPGVDSDVTLSQVATAGGQLFSNEYYANQYSGATAPVGVLVPSGFYSDDTLSISNQYFEFAEGVLGSTQTCIERIQYETAKVTVFYSEINQTSIDAACLAGDKLTQAELWCRVGIDTFINFTEESDKLEYLLQNQVVIFTTEGAANALDYGLMWNNTTFIASKLVGDNYIALNTFAVWENDNSSGYTGNFSWYGSHSDTEDLISGSANAELGNCSGQFQRPDYTIDYNECLGLDNNECDPDASDNSRENVYYAFLSCENKTQAGDPYWPLYVIDGMHTVGVNSTSYIKEFVDAAGINVTLGGDTMIGCTTLIHKIFAVNINDAIDIVSGEYPLDLIRPVAINPVDLGFTSGAAINYGYADCATCLLSGDFTSSFTLDTIDDADIINRSVPNFDLEKNYQLDNVSKPLLRTNPKLSTNAKLVVNSTGKMYIESIDATKDLASVEYKKWAVNKDGEWSRDLYRFFKQSKTPADQIYIAKKSYSDFSVQESFDKQIEEDYHYGTKYNYSKLHNEDFRMMAPIWLDKNVPSNFIIFRVSDPAILDFDTQSNFDNLSELLENSEIIKTFDLTRGSELGTYIRNHVQSESFPKNPITVNFAENEKTSFNGINMKEGGFTSKGEYLHDDLIRRDQAIIAENNLITGGFERNNLACANLINMEFLFDDNNSSDYSVNRYFGLYVNAVDSGYGTLASANNGLIKFKNLNSYINDDASSAIPPFKLIKNTPTLGYAQVSKDFYKISPRVLYDPAELEVRVEDGSNKISSQVRLAANGKSINIEKNNKAGGDFIKVNIVDNPAVNDRFGIFPAKEQLYRIKFSRYTPGDIFSISLTINGQQLTLSSYELTPDLEGLAESLTGLYGTGTNRDNIIFEKETDTSVIIYEKRGTLERLEPSIVAASINNTTLARIEELQTPYDLQNNMFFAVDHLPAGHFNSTSFSNQGTKSEIATAIVKSINSIDNGFTAITHDKAEYFYIKTDITGYNLLQAGIAIPFDNSNDWAQLDSNKLDVNNLLRLEKLETQNNILSSSEIYFFSGGNDAEKSIRVTLDSVEDLNIGDYIETRSNGVYNKVIDIVDDIEILPLRYKKVVLERRNTLESGEINVFADNIVRLGLFSAFDIHDLNFDFYDTENSDLKELQFETAAEINYEPEVNNETDIYPFGDRDNTNYTLDPITYFTGLNDILLEEQADEFDEVHIKSEYDRLQENYLKQYATESRVVPTINKWVLKDTKTVREQPYYLNANESFGRSNFSPDLSVPGRDRLGMTHEWFYVNNLPKHLVTNQGSLESPEYRLNESFSYVNFMEGFEITPNIFKDTNYDYFDRFFVTEGFETIGDNKYKTFVKTNLQKKYTLVENGNDMSFANTIFKGLKVTFKNRKEFNANSPVDFIKSSEFNGYKFSIMLNVKTAQESNGVDYEVIQNKKFKFVVFFISLSLDDLWADQTLTKKLLYELNHSLIWNSEEQTFKYSDIKLDGCLDFNSLNQTNDQADDYLQLTGLRHADGSMPQFLEQINKNIDDEFSNILVKINTAFGPQYLQLEIESLTGQDGLILRGPVKDITNGIANAPDADLDNMPHYLQWNAEYTYIQGGINAYKSILDALAIQNVSNMLLRDPGNVKYTTVNLNGTIEQNKFIILFEDGVEIIKESYLVTVEDDDKPESFRLFSGVIGYDLAPGLEYYPFLIRHNGGYTVDTTPVVTFTDIYAHMKTNTLQSTSNTNELKLEEQMYKHSLSELDEINIAKDYYKRYNRCGTSFNLGFIYDAGTHDSNWGLIKNHFYRKVNEFNTSGVTKLSVSTDKLPVYPLIGEVAIDKKDVNVFRSSWDKNYYTRSVSGGGSEPVPGTFETKEEKSYLASTVMKIKDSYTLLNFDIQKVETEEETDEILLNGTNTTDIVIHEGNDRIVIDFYIDFSINKVLSSDGVFNTISKYVLPIDSAEDKTTLEDDARLYIEKNLINVFGVNQIKLYTQRFKGGASEIESASTIEGLDNGGYVIDQNFTFKAHEQKPLNFRLIYNKRLGYSYRIRPMVKITS